MNKCQANVIFRFLFIQLFSKNLKSPNWNPSSPLNVNTAMLSKSLKERAYLFLFNKFCNELPCHSSISTLLFPHLYSYSAH